MNDDISTISSMSSADNIHRGSLFLYEQHPMCDTNCFKPTKPLDQYIASKGCMFCDEDCMENFTGIYPTDIEHHREDTLSYESDEDYQIKLECDICLCLNDEDQIIYCTGCQNNSCGGCRDEMIANGGQDCGDREEYLCPTCYKKSRRHLYFDDNGNEISYEEYLKLRDHLVWAFNTPQISSRPLRHPRVLLNFLRYVDSHNKFAEPDELIFLKPIPQGIYHRMIMHQSIQNPSDDFKDDALELLELISDHVDLS